MAKKERESMDDPRVSREPHAVCIAFPSQGHIKAMLQLAKLLHSRAIRITFVHTESNHNRIAAAGAASTTEGLDGFRFETIPDCVPPGASKDQNQDLSSLCIAIRRQWSAPFRDLVVNRLSTPPTCIICDIFTSFGAGVAAELAIPAVFFCSLSACGYMSTLHVDQFLQRGLIPLKNEGDFTNGHLDTPINWIPGLKKNMQLKHLNSCFLTTDPEDVFLNFVRDELQDSWRADAIVMNTFHDLEGLVLDSMPDLLLPPVYSVGPLNVACRRIPATSRVNSIGSSLWEEDPGCSRWLEGKPEKSVLYVNFGSLVVMTDQQLTEFAWGVADSGYDFVWAIRPGIVMGESAVLPEEFSTETSGRGLVTSWCPQEEVLAHRSVGGFLTHCGWNSVLESVSAGVPMVCWPLAAEQGVNCLYACDEWGVGLEIDGDVRRENVAELVRVLMGSEKGAEMRLRALEWKEAAAAAAIGAGGTSCQDFDRLLEEVLLRGRSTT